MNATGTSTGGTWLGGVARLTRVTDHLAHVLQHSQINEPVHPDWPKSARILQAAPIDFVCA